MTDLDNLCANCGRRFGDHALKGCRCPGGRGSFKLSGASRQRAETLEDLLKLAALLNVHPIWRRVELELQPGDEGPSGSKFVLVNRDEIEAAANRARERGSDGTEDDS